MTNTYFEGSGKYNDLAANGHSKEKRTDCPLVTLGLVLDRSGFPIRSKVFAGNASEPHTLAKMIKGLKRSPLKHAESTERQQLFKQGKPTIVMDTGIATDHGWQKLWLSTVVFAASYCRCDEQYLRYCFLARTF